MAMSFKRRRSGPSARVYAIGAGVAVALLVGAVLWFSSAAESRAPEQRDIRIEATNVGPR